LSGFGYRVLFSESTWSVSAEAIVDTTLCILEKNTLVKVLKKNADLTLKFLKVVTEELWISDNRTISLTQKHVSGRLAESLLILRDTYGYESDKKTIGVSLSREDIAHLSNMTTSNAIRTLSNMASDGIIELKGRKITILDNTSLEQISEQG
jgi:CRP-like cAMP-binding protein